MTKTSTPWFEVDKDGLREIHASFPPERIVSELVQNVFDEDAKICRVTIADSTLGRRNTTVLVVEDDSPEGFKDLRHAFTLFASTSKRSNAEKRGRFNLGEKIVFARSFTAKVETTKGTLIFDDTGRHSSSTARAAGSIVTAVLPRWTVAEHRDTLEFLRRINPPRSIQFNVNGETIAHRDAEITRETTLPTELLSHVEGVQVMSKTRRKTTVEFRRKAGAEAFLYEMGIPVVAIDGGWDADVGQKVPLSHDRTTVSLSFLKEVYAELLNALSGSSDVSDLGAGILKVALESERIAPTTARDVFTKIYGENAVIQSGFSPDANQEAARANWTLVPAKTFGAEVNAKLRDGGVKTSHEVFGRSALTQNGSLAPDVKPVPTEPKHERFLRYAKMLRNELFADDPHYAPTDFTVELGVMQRRTGGVNFGKTHIIFNIAAGYDFEHPVSACSHLILHELSHAFGNEHDGVYDHATERLVNKAMALLARNPEKFREFEPELFASPSAARAA